MDVDLSERNPLFSAIQEGSLPIVRLLIEGGIDYQLKYNNGTFADMDAEAFAIERGELEIAAYLKSLKR